jgi:hypothetical protein
VLRTACVNNGGDGRRRPSPTPPIKQHKVGSESVPVKISLDFRETFVDHGQNKHAR